MQQTTDNVKNLTTTTASTAKEKHKATPSAPSDDRIKKTQQAKRKKSESVMAQFLSMTAQPPSVGDMIEGAVIGIEKASVYVDLPPFGTGIIYGREFLNARDTIKKINIGDVIAAKVVDTGNKNGYIELSLKEARQTLIWAEAEEMIKNKTVLELPVKDANKGGLIFEWQGIQGFLPASQLKAEHYPRVEDGDKDKILEELKKLVGQRISVSILSVAPKEGKLIFSEKDTEQKEKREIVEKYAVGDEVEGVVTGTVDFGIFVKLEEGLEGLVHISEIDWALVEDPRKMYKAGDVVKVKVIEIKDGKISLSIKALKDNPWKGAEEKYKKGDRVEGVIIKYNKHGALASIEEGIAGLIHISEFNSEEELRQTLELGKTYPFIITLFDVKEQRMALSYKEAMGLAKGSDKES
jgi:small subunit ribosomal protein S1